MTSDEKDEDDYRRWFSVALRLHGDALPVDRVSELLELPACATGLKEEHINNNPRYAIRDTNLWTSTWTKDDLIPFDEQLEPLIRHLEIHERQLAGLLEIEGVEAELFLGYGADSGQGGTIFAPELLGRIAKLRLFMVLNLYPPGLE